jgi:hypothetical protein
MTLDGRMFHFTSSATIRQLLEVLTSKEDNGMKVIKEMKKGGKECR